MPRLALDAAKRCVAAVHDPACDGFAAEISATQALYDDPETRRKVSEFLTKSAT
jgi:hypothetical protein